MFAVHDAEDTGATDSQCRPISATVTKWAVFTTGLSRAIRIRRARLFGAKKIVDH